MAESKIETIASRIAFLQRTPDHRMTEDQKRNLRALKRAYIAAVQANGERLTFAPYTNERGEGVNKC